MYFFTTTKFLCLMKSLISMTVPINLISIYPCSRDFSSSSKLKGSIGRVGKQNINSNTAALNNDQTNNENNSNNNNDNPSEIVGNPICPGSPTLKNAKCVMTIVFHKPISCSMVQTEITSRMNGDNGWVDPHNNGTYTILNELINYEEQMTQITGSRVTGDGKYTDLFIFTLEEDKKSGGGGCILSSCSESQVFSVIDFSTNYCNLHNLYCNKNDGCEIVKYSLDYQEKYIDCWQRDVQKCIVAGNN